MAVDLNALVSELKALVTTHLAHANEHQAAGDNRGIIYHLAIAHAIQALLKRLGL